MVDPQRHRWVDVEVVQAFERDEPYLAGLNLSSVRRQARAACVDSRASCRVYDRSREWPLTGRRPMTADQRVEALEMETVGHVRNHATTVPMNHVAVQSVSVRAQNVAFGTGPLVGPTDRQTADA